MGATKRLARIRSATVVLTVECSLLFALACDEPVFEPFAESDVYFSIFGVLNASADTQWIRISPIRESLSLSAELFDAVVTLEHVGNGDVFELQDTVVRFTSLIEGAADEIRHNFWTTHSIEAGATYRLKVTRSDGASSDATVTVAERFDTVLVGYVPDWFTYGYGYIGDEGGGFVRVPEAEHLAFVQVRHLYTCDQTPGYHPVTFYPPDSASALVSISLGFAAEQLPCAVERQSLFVVASGSEWPEGEAFNPNMLGLPDRLQSMQNGIGFLGGVVTESVPVESCVIPAWIDPMALETPCEVTYSPESATMRGTVRDALCGGALGGAIVELEAPPGGGHPYARLRSVRTELDGTYRIAGLDPEAPHIRRVWDESEWFVAGRIWAAQEDTAEFLPGQQLTADFELERRLSPLGIPLGRPCGD